MNSGGLDGGIDVATIDRIAHDEAMRIADVERDRFTAAIASVRPDQWAQPTDCSRWDVAAVVAHVVGAAAAQASVREFVRQVRSGRRIVDQIGGGEWWDGMNEVQVRERAGRSGPELAAEWERVGRAALRARRRLPRPVRRLPVLSLPAPIGRQPIAYLFDMGFTRDVWVHRIDLALATGGEFVADASHDGRILADIVAEWAGTHDEPFDLRLTGASGGRFRRGAAAITRLSAVDFIRILAGRLDGDGVLSHRLPL